MLAQNFKTAEELGIFEKEKEALIKVLGMLERGELKHATKWREVSDPPIGFTGHFNMETWATSADCGTVCCIGGTAELIGGITFSAESRYEQGGRGKDRELNKLFYPNAATYKGITVSQAAVAVRNYLTTGNANWDEILG